jgi:hypothetical protein
LQAAETVPNHLDTDNSKSAPVFKRRGEFIEYGNNPYIESRVGQAAGFFQYPGIILAIIKHKHANFHVPFSDSLKKIISWCIFLSPARDQPAQNIFRAGEFIMVFPLRA